jgi:hypothetical protein
MASEKLPVTLIAKKLGRAERAIKDRARALGIELKQPNRKP